MRTLFDDRWAPVTTELGFIERPAAEVASWYARWLDGIPGERGRPASVRTLSGGLESNLRELLPLTLPVRRRHLFQETSSAWTAYFDNGARNTDAAHLSLVARELGCRAMRIVAIEDRGPSCARRGAAIFELYGPAPTEFLNYVRSVALVHDATWQFSVAGRPQPFERVERYDAKRCRDRFNLELLAEYALALGVSCFDDAFYLASGRLVEHSRVIGAAERTLSLSEARDEVGIARP